MNKNCLLWLALLLDILFSDGAKGEKKKEHESIEYSNNIDVKGSKQDFKKYSFLNSNLK